MAEKYKNNGKATYLISVKDDYRIKTAFDSLDGDEYIYEVIVVCDGCTEEFIKFVKSNIDGRSFKSVILTRPNSTGLAAALNYGMAFCSTKYLARLDADDYNIKGRTEIQIEFLVRNSNLTLVGSNCIFKPENCVSNLPIKHHEISTRFFKETVLLHPTVMFNMENLQSLRYPEQFSKGAQDLVFWAELISKGHYLGNIPNALVNYTVTNRFRWSRVLSGFLAYLYCGKLLEAKFLSYFAGIRLVLAAIYSSTRRR